MPVAGTHCPGWNFSAVSLALGIAPTYATLPMRPLDAGRSWREASGKCHSWGTFFVQPFVVDKKARLRADKE
jgi:hypothetical protein